MIITPEQENSPPNTMTNEDVMSLQNTLHTRQDINTEDDNMNTSMHCCVSNLQKSNMAEFDNSCVTDLACLRLSDNSTFSPSKLRQQKKTNPRLDPLNNLILPKKKSPRIPRKALFLSDDDDNEVFHPSPSSSPTTANSTSSPTSPMPSDVEKQEVIAGRLYLIRQIGNTCQTSGSPSSPSRSFKPFNFSTGLSSPTSSPPSLQSPNIKRKLPVYVRVYKCHKDHFALISRDSSYSTKHIYLNMRHCRVMPGDPLGRFIVAGNSDSGSLMEFETPDLSSLEGWLDALQTQTPPESPIRISTNFGSGGNSKNSNNTLGSPSIPKSPGLPTLSEAEED